MNLGASFSMLLLWLIKVSHAWVPLSRVTRDVATTSATLFSTRYVKSDGLSMRFRSAEEKVETAHNTKPEAFSLLGVSKPSTQEPLTPPRITPNPSAFSRWMNEKANEISASPTELVHEHDQEKSALNPTLFVAGAAAGILAISAVASAAKVFDLSYMDAVNGITSALEDPSATLDQVIQTIESMGPVGAFYFCVAYTVAEVLAIPAIPLTASAGYIFGPLEGTAVVLLSASIAASISFVIGRTLLRDYVEKVLEDYPQFAKLDRAIGREGFKLMLVLRLSPIFPFALSNYLYGASSINFPAFFWGTLLGFAPGTIAFVCTGAFGKALQVGGDSTYPWYFYAGGLIVLGGFIKILAETASRVVEEMERDEDDTTPGDKSSIM